MLARAIFSSSKALDRSVGGRGSLVLPHGQRAHGLRPLASRCRELMRSSGTFLLALADSERPELGAIFFQCGEMDLAFSEHSDTLYT